MTREQHAYQTAYDMLANTKMFDMDEIDQRALEMEDEDERNGEPKSTPIQYLTYALEAYMLNQ